MLDADHPQSLNPHPLVRGVLAVWIALAMAVAVKTLVSPEHHTVFPKMAARAVAWWSGQNLYTQYEDLGRFPYSPTFAIALTPLAVLGNRAGGVLWCWISIVIYVWGLRRLIRDVLPGAWPPPREAALLLLAMIGAIRGLWNAQSNAIIIGLLMLGASAVARRRWWEAACLLGGPVFIKLWAVAVVLLLAALAPRKLAPRITVVLVIGLALPLLTQSWGVVADQYAAWFAFLQRMSDDVSQSYRDVWTLLRTAGAQMPAAIYRLIQAGTAGIALAWCLWLQYQGMQPSRLLTITLSVGAAWALALGPAVEYNTYVVLAPMASWAVLESYELRRGRGLATTAFMMTMLLGAGSIERILRQLSPIAMAILPAGTLVLVAGLAATAATTDRPTTATGPHP